MMIKLRAGNNRGFTIVELMIAILISSILILTAGIMLYYGWKGWHKNSVKMALQGDAIYAMDILDRTIRPVKNADLSISGLELRKSGNGFLRFNAGNLERFSNGSYHVILNNITSPSFSLNPVTVNMTLQRQVDQNRTESLALNFVVGGRN